MTPEERLAELGLELPPVQPPVASYIPIVISGGLAFLAGQVPQSEGKPLWVGRVGEDVEEQAGTEAARRCGLQVLAVLRDALGSLDRVRRIVKLSVFVASSPGFTGQPRVANGASDLMAEVFGEAGRHARTSVGVPDLPLGVPVEVEAVVEVSD